MGTNKGLQRIAHGDRVENDREGGQCHANDLRKYHQKKISGGDKENAQTRETEGLEKRPEPEKGQF